jgi:hypothetical protein
MERIAVTSTSIKSIGYHAESQTLEVEYHSPTDPRVYQFYPVTQERAEAFFAPDVVSVGRLMNELKRDATVASVRVEEFVATTDVF